MNRILLDTNIILDIALQRSEFGEDAKKLMLFIAKHKINSYITASSITDIYYVLKKEKGHTHSIDFLKNLIQLIKVFGVDEEIIICALNSEMQDFEDAVQTETAISNGVGILITRDKKDYKHSGLKIFSPIEYMNEFIQP